MKIEEIKLTEIKPYENNPRKNDAAVESVAESIRQFGFKQPIVVDKDNVIVAGHTRYKAAKKLKLKTAPCVRAEDLTEEQVKAYRILDNKIAERAAWNLDALYAELSSFEFDFKPFEVDFDSENFIFDFPKLENDTVGVKEKDQVYDEDWNLSHKYAVVVETETEEEQRDIFKEMSARNYKVRCIRI